MYCRIDRMKLFRSLTIIKVFHSLLFFIFSATVIVVLWSGITGDISDLSWIAFITVLLEGMILLLNGWKCPLTSYAEKVGASDGSVADIFLPKWFAERLFFICGSIFFLATLLLLYRKFW